MKLAQTQIIYLQMAAGEQGLGGTQITPTMTLTPPGRPLSTPSAARSFAFATSSTNIMVVSTDAQHTSTSLQHILTRYILWVLHALVTCCSGQAGTKAMGALVLLQSVS